MPLRPIPLTPAFRFGAQTPWGGDRLRALLGKNAPDAPVGESLELSALPGLECRNAQGIPLSELLRKYGARLSGTDFTGEFPLLLKLLDAREDLSVQVHPSSAYAQAHFGKQGKDEAWVILDAKPGARLVLGLKEGTKREDLERAALSGHGMEELLRYVPVQAGDAFLIPAGTVHAILGGIVLYEIQQSSDLTFRLFDWGRVDAQGKPRQLHIRESLDVVDVDSWPEAAKEHNLADGEAGMQSLLIASQLFCVFQLTDCRGYTLPRDLGRFSVLTALADGVLECDGFSTPLTRGQSVLLPADGYVLHLECASAMLSAPAIHP